MSIKKIVIQNFKRFKKFELSLQPTINILVGNNEEGKSTILEAVHLALTGYYEGKNINNVLSQYMFNKEIVDQYLASIQTESPIPPPEIVIEIYFNNSIDPILEGSTNNNKVKAEGIRFTITYNEKYSSEYKELIQAKKLNSLPIEYYEASWCGFDGNGITIRGIPIKSSMIDSSSFRYQNGSDVYISRIVRNFLTEEEITAVVQAHRNMKEQFMDDPSIKQINKRIEENSTMTGGKVSLSVDLGTKKAWENSLVTELDNIPFSYIGQGYQCIVKTALALSQTQTKKSEILLLEEPECHLSYSTLNKLISSIIKQCQEKQIIISTHSSFVANKLGLKYLILLENGKNTTISELSSTSVDFFKKIAGYDTLRLLLCKKAILVEGDSDELVVQKAYMVSHEGRLPIEDGIDVISVGMAFLRFLEIADKLEKTVAVVTDNDGNLEALEEKYKQYLGENKKPYITICYDSNVDIGSFEINNKYYNYNTLEPKMLKENSLQLFNSIFRKNYETENEMQKYMRKNKTACALDIFNTIELVKFPEYIMKAVCDGQ